MNDTTPAGEPRRLAPADLLPPYAYVSGRFPHPTSDPAGHSYGHAPEDPPPFDPEHWQQSHEYLLACDLFNFGYYWEAHETWEALWKACGRAGTTADFLKALIKLAAAGVKAREGRKIGVLRHAHRAVELITSVQSRSDGTRYAGLDLGWLLAVANRLASDPPLGKSPTAPVEVIFDFAIWPS